MWGRPPRPSSKGEAERHPKIKAERQSPLPSVGEQKTKIKRRDGSKEMNLKNGNAAGPATRPHRSWFPALPVTAWRRNDRFSPTALLLSRASECRVCQSELPDSSILAITNWQPPAVASGPVLLLPLRRATEQVGEEAATPGQPVALARVFWNVPRRFTLENHQLPLALPQSFGKLRNSHVSLNPLSATLLRPATQKTSALVQKLWTMRLPCGRPRKTKN